MSAQRSPEDWAALYRVLGERLSTCPEVTRQDGGERQEPWALAHALVDLEESFRAFLEDQLPRLVREQLQPSEIFDLPLDIGEEFRHILYHIKDPRFYSYLHVEGDDELGVSEKSE